MFKLDAAQHQSYMSQYLQNDWKQEKIVLTSVLAEPGKIIGYLDVQEFVPDNEGRFHLSAQTALAWMSQIAIIYGCWDNNLAHKMGEVYLRQMQLRFTRAIRKTRDIQITAHVAAGGRRTLSDKSIYYKDMAFSLEDGAFTGTGSFILPTHNQKANPQNFQPAVAEMH